MKLPTRLQVVFTKRYRFRVPKLYDRHDIVHWLHDHLHTAYFAGVYIEGHSVYAKIAGLLFLLAVASMFVVSEHIE